MERLILTQQLRAALTAHELWSSHLVQAALSGRSKMTVTEAGDDERCDFGRWLLKIGDLPEVPQVEAVRETHRHFHEEAAAVLELALTGKRAQASLAVGPGSRFDEASARLRAALMDWVKSL
jgi:hypothetical protein